MMPRVKPAAAVLHALTPQEVAERIKRLSAQGWSEYQIASLFNINIQHVRRMIGHSKGCDV